MNNIISLKRGKWVAGLLAALVLTACSDWTEVEPVAINEADIAKQNPALYAGYLENLRSYKKSVHKVMITWFNNSNKVPLSRADHTDVLPDSIDIVSMMHPVNPAQYELDEMEKVRSEKGTKFVYDMNFEAIKLIYEEMVADMEDAAPEEGGVAMAEIPAFVDFLVDTVNQILPLARKYSYDGIIIGYKGGRIFCIWMKRKSSYILPMKKHL